MIILDASYECTLLMMFQFWNSLWIQWAIIHNWNSLWIFPFKYQSNVKHSQIGFLQKKSWKIIFPSFYYLCVKGNSILIDQHFSDSCHKIKPKTLTCKLFLFCNQKKLFWYVLFFSFFGFLTDPVEWLLCVQRNFTLNIYLISKTMLYNSSRYSAILSTICREHTRKLHFANRLLHKKRRWQ